jgi:hypothetical protein
MRFLARLAHHARWGVGAGTAIGVLVACGGDSPEPKTPKRALPAYAGRGPFLFDDQIEARAVGLDLADPGEARFEDVFRERTRAADAVLRVRIDTVTVRNEATGPAYQLGLRSVDRLGGKSPPADPFVVLLSRESRGLAKDFEGRLVGKTFIAFVRLFVRSDGDSELHFHFAPDTKTVEAAVREAVVLDEVK